MNVRIVGCGHYLPEKILTNYDLRETLDTTHEWIFSRTGIVQRHIAHDNENTSDIATNALQNALKNSSIRADDLDGIILATTTSDLLMPSTAALVQRNIGMHHGFAFDVQAVCSGFLYALNVGYSMIKAGQAKKLAIIGAEVMSRIINWEDRKTCVLFGDGAGAVVLSADNAESIIGIDIYSDGRTSDILRVCGGISAGNLNAKLEMNGADVFRFAVEHMESAVLSILKKHNILITELDWLLPHQANYRILKSVAEALSIDQSKVISTVAMHANTSAASIPLALSEYVQLGTVKNGDLIAMTAVGAGMTWGSALLRL